MELDCMDIMKRDWDALCYSMGMESRLGEHQVDPKKKH